MCDAKNIFITYLGGTIGMKVIRKAYEPVPDYLPNALRAMNIMHNAQYAEKMNEIDPEKSFLYLPLSDHSPAKIETDQYLLFMIIILEWLMTNVSLIISKNMILYLIQRT